MNGLKHRPFCFLKNYGAQNGGPDVEEVCELETAKNLQGQNKWFVEYRFRIPEEPRYRYAHAKWKGFRVYEDINRYKTEEYNLFKFG